MRRPPVGRGRGAAAGKPCYRCRGGRGDLERRRRFLQVGRTRTRNGGRCLTDRPGRRCFGQRAICGIAQRFLRRVFGKIRDPGFRHPRNGCRGDRFRRNRVLHGDGFGRDRGGDFLPLRGIIPGVLRQGRICGKILIRNVNLGRRWVGNRFGGGRISVRRGCINLRCRRFCHRRCGCCRPADNRDRLFVTFDPCAFGQKICGGFGQAKPGLALEVVAMRTCGKCNRVHAELHRKSLGLFQCLARNDGDLNNRALARPVKDQIIHSVGRAPFKRSPDLLAPAGGIGAGGLDLLIENLAFWQDQFGAKIARGQFQRGAAQIAQSIGHIGRGGVNRPDLHPPGRGAMQYRDAVFGKGQREIRFHSTALAQVRHGGESPTCRFCSSIAGFRLMKAKAPKE